MNYQFFTKFLFVLSFMLIISACQNEATQPTESSQTNETNTNATPPNDKITIAYVPSLSSMSIYFAIEGGYFAEQGIDAELEAIYNPVNMIAVLNSGEVDIAVNTMALSVMNATSQEIDLTFIAGVLEDNNNSLVVRKSLVDSGEVTGIGDLANRKIGIIAIKTMGEYTLETYMLQPNGLSVDDVNLIAMPIADTIVALENGAIDAAYLWEPFTTRSVEEGIAVQMELDYDPIQTLQFQIGKNLMDPSKKDVVVRFLSAYLEATRDLHEEGMNDEVVQILSKYTNIPPEVVQKMPIVKFSPNGEINVASLEAQMQYYIDKGYAEIDEPLTTEQYIDFSFLEEALERVGPYEN